MNGPSLVVAGAGSGKTSVLTYKISYLINSGLNPNRILALTFTNKAANEMKERIDNLLNTKVSNKIWMGTFHSIFGRILRFEAQSLGFTSNFTIYDTSDSVNLVKALIKELNLNDDFYKAKSIFNRISSCKNNLMTAEAYSQRNDLLNEDKQENRPEFVNIYKKYSQRCRQSNVMDFDDLLLYTNILFKINPEALNKYKNKFDYILVDEYQDTNFAQYLIVKRLSEDHRKLFVVGDDAQSIYSFRGAKIQNILNFKNDYSDYKLFKLEQNYRSTQNIVNLANSLIKNNVGQIPKTIFSDNEKGPKTRVVRSMTDKLEGMSVARMITDMCNIQHFDFSDFAILYRTNAQSRIMEEYMRKYNIKYKVFGGLSFYQRKEIKDVLAYMRFVVNHNDVEAFRRIVNYPSRKIGGTTVSKILDFSGNSEIPVWDLIKSPHDYNIKINAPTKDRIIAFAKLIEFLSSKTEELNAYDFTVELVNKTGLNSELFVDKTPEGVSRYENIQELLNGVKSFCDERDAEGIFNGTTIYDYLENVTLLTDVEENDNEEIDRVSLMTIHSAKGLEFTNVFIVGVEENIIPNAMTLYSPNELEEERRLFYVAITRAKKNLVITYSNSRFKFGNITSMVHSRFLDELDSSYLEWNDKSVKKPTSFEDELKRFSSQTSEKEKISIKQKKSQKPIKSSNRKLVSLKDAEVNSQNSQTSVSDFNIGQKVKHKLFGEGVIENLTGKGADIKAVVAFKDGETKTILLKFAKLEILA